MLKIFLSLPISFPILVNVIPYQIYIQNTQITVFNFFQPNLEHYQYYKNAPTVLVNMMMMMSHITQHHEDDDDDDDDEHNEDDDDDGDDDDDQF